MTEVTHQLQRNPSWRSTLLRVILICGGCVAILLPAWLPNRPTIPIERATVEILQAILLAASATMMLGAAPHAGNYKPVCWVLALGLIAGVEGKIGDFVSNILKWKFPNALASTLILLPAVIIMIRHRRVMLHFFAGLGNHAGSGLIGAALLIIGVFNRVIGSKAFWKATLGGDFPPEIPRICKSYLELLACYLIFIGALGLSITMARRKEPF